MASTFRLNKNWSNDLSNLKLDRTFNQITYNTSNLEKYFNYSKDKIHDLQKYNFQNNEISFDEVWYEVTKYS